MNDRARKAYVIEADTFTEAIDSLVRAFKEKNPGIARFAATCHDGTTVRICVEAKKPRVRR